MVVYSRRIADGEPGKRVEKERREEGRLLTR